MAQVETTPDAQGTGITSLFSFHLVLAERPGFSRKGITIT
jgi:hypothetical protein